MDEIIKFFGALLIIDAQKLRQIFFYCRGLCLMIAFDVDNCRKMHKDSNGLKTKVRKEGAAFGSSRRRS